MINMPPVPNHDHLDHLGPKSASRRGLRFPQGDHQDNHHDHLAGARAGLAFQPKKAPKVIIFPHTSNERRANDHLGSAASTPKVIKPAETTIDFQGMGLPLPRPEEA